MKSILKLGIVLLTMPLMLVHGQKTDKISGDSLSLNEILNVVIQNYPAIKKAQSDITSADAKIELAKTAYLPDVNVSASYTFLGPTSTITIPYNGVPTPFQLYPANNYSAMLNVNENIYDFGKTEKNVAFEKQSKEMVGLSIDQLKQKLSGMMVGNFYSIVFLQEAINIKDEELATLKAHFHFVEKKAASGSATKYEILTTKVRISNNETQKADLQNALLIQLSQLNSYLGKTQDTKLKVKNELLAPQIFATSDSLFNFAFIHRNEMKIAKQKSALYDTRLKIVSSVNKPSVNVFGSGGLKNGYLPDINVLTPNYALGVGIKVPIFDANRSKYTKIQANSDIQANIQETELIRRNIVNEVVECKANAESALKKLQLTDLQLDQAKEAYSLAETNFEVGAITNVELMFSFTAITDSKLALLKSKIEYSVSLLKLKLALGEQIY
jgi:outer membrane protein TolC